MLSKQIVENVLHEALANGGDFAEVFIEDTNSWRIQMLAGKIDSALSGTDFGVGIRVFNGLNALYAFSNDVSEKGLLKLAREIAAAVNNPVKAKILELKQQELINKHVINLFPNQIAKPKIVNYMKEANKVITDYDAKINQAIINYFANDQKVLIANSNGKFVTDRRVRTRFTTTAIAANENSKQTGSQSFGAMLGFELVEGLDIEKMGKEAARSAVTMLDAKMAPSGKMPVIIDNAFGGVIFHEACGHSLEATSVAKNDSVFAGKLNEQIASSIVTAVDDGTITNAWGSLNIDDEGNETQRNVLIENGILKSYLVDELNGRRMNTKSTGSGRRESYRYAPTSRMNNTFIAPGNDSVDEIISSTKYGLYAKYMGGGSVEPSTGDFNFAVLEGYMVRDGKICEPVKGATLIGRGSEVLMKIDRVADNIDHAPGMCGSLSGSVPTNVGQPMIRVTELTVGGRE